MRHTVYCIASTEPQANSILTELRNLEFPPSDISVVLPNRTNTKNIGVQPDVIRGAETGGLAGEIVGWLSGLTVLALPGVGAFFIAGPLIAAFGGAVAGGVVGALAGGTGAVHPLGLPEDVGRKVEEHLRHGGILISVHSSDSAVQERAVRAFKAMGANEIYYSDGKAAA